MLVFIAGSLAALCGLVYFICPSIAKDLVYLRVAFRYVTWLQGKIREKKWLVDMFEDTASRVPSKTFILYDDRKVTFEYVNRQANKVANLAIHLGWKSGDVVALVIHNEPAFVWTYLGLAKIGVVTSLINTNLRAKSLRHCVEVCNARALIVGQSRDLQNAIKDIEISITVFAQGGQHETFPDIWRDFDECLSEMSDGQPDRRMRSNITTRSSLCYVFTSGTTGLPKPAIITQDRFVKTCGIHQMIEVGQDDVIYTALPLYHTAALIMLQWALQTGSTLVLRKKFSASRFWDDCRKHNVTVINYIGEVCRYLLSQPESVDDRTHTVRKAFGNGLRKDIWKTFQKRFAIENIYEFYAATEGNMFFLNLLNKEGSCGYFSPLLNMIIPIRFLAYDVDKAHPVRDDKGWCVPAKPGEPGLAVCRISEKTSFDGYAGKKEHTEKKIIRNAFKQGDAYFNSGDLLIRDKDYFVYFSDRIGDTFRWKGENVSTTEVANILTDITWIEDANVYGVSVQGYDGKCGMTSLTLMSGHTVEEKELLELYEHCVENLASYAQPRFVRIQHEMLVTGTFKQKKVSLVEEGFNPTRCHGDALFYKDVDKKTYSYLDTAAYDAIISGQIRI